MSLDDPTRPCRHHDWQAIGDDPDTPPTGYECTRCPASAHPCGTCWRPIDHAAVRTCPDCVGDARNLVRDIRDLYAALPDVIASIAGLHAIRYDRGGTAKPTKGGKGADTTIIGGAALVMAAGGTLNQPHPLPDDLDPHERSIDVALRVAESQDPPSVLAVLTQWEDEWRREQRQAASETTSVREAAEYLVVHMTWAAQHSETWGAFVEETRQLRWRLRILTGDDRRPVKAGVPCPYCAGTIVQRWKRDGLSDVRECDVCHLTWASEAHFMLAIREAHQALPDTHPDQLVTLDDAKRIYKPRGVRPSRLDVWVARGTLRPMIDTAGAPMRDVRGDLLYRLGNVAVLADRGEEAS